MLAEKKNSCMLSVTFSKIEILTCKIFANKFDSELVRSVQEDTARSSSFFVTVRSTTCRKNSPVWTEQAQSISYLLHGKIKTGLQNLKFLIKPVNG